MNTSTLSPSPFSAGLMPSVPVSVTCSDEWMVDGGIAPWGSIYGFDTLVPDFYIPGMGQTQPEIDALVARWLWYQHWDDFWAGSHAAGVAELVGACCPVRPEDFVWFCQWPEEVAA